MANVTVRPRLEGPTPSTWRRGRGVHNVRPNGSLGYSRMGVYRARGLTNGYLPEAAFLHLAPTAMGYVDLEAPLALKHPAPESAGSECRDALVMVRLHGEPLAIIHI